MNLKDRIVQNPIVNKISLVISLIFILSLIYIFTRSISRVVRPPLTEPIFSNVTPTVSPPLDTSNPFNPGQRFIFNWGAVEFPAQTSMNNYQITDPIVNTTTISNIAGKIGFKATDQSQDTNPNDYMWANNTDYLLGSPNQNQISYYTTLSLQPHTKNISPSEATNIAKNIIADFLGNQVISSLNSNPEVKYGIHSPTDADNGPAEASPETANIITINFKQNLKDLPIISLSTKGEIISVGIDTSGKLYFLYVYGGFYTFSEIGETRILNFSELQSVAPVDNIRISYSKDIESERGFTDAKQIAVNVESIKLGYFQRKDNALFPVFIIDGKHSAQGLDSYSATYIIPAVKPQP